MKDLPVLRSASLDQMRDVTTSGLSRRGFLMGTSAVGGLALAAAARGGAQGIITTTAQFAKLASYGGNAPPKAETADDALFRRWPPETPNRPAG